MTDEWHPRIRRRMLSGVSAHRLSVIESWCLGIGMVCVVVGLALLWVADQPIPAALVGLPGAIGVTAARMLHGVVSTRETREHAAGYITLVQGTGPADVEHVDSQTGRLVSFAGENLTDSERRARIAAIRADARLGAGQPDRLLTATGGDPADGVGHTDEALFTGRPRTFITLPWTVRQGAVWGLLFVGLVPVGFLIVALLDASTSVPAAVAPVALGVVLVTAAIGTVVLIVAMRRADTMLDESGPGGSGRSRGVVMSLWIVPLAVAVLVAGGFVYGTYQGDRLAELRSDGVRVTAHDAEARKTSSGRGARMPRTEVRAVVDYGDGARQIRLDHDRRLSLPDDLSRGTWTEAPAPYDGTVTVVHHLEDPDFVVAEADLADAEAFIPVTGLDRAALMSAAWGVPWLVAWVVMVRRAATAEPRS